MKPAERFTLETDTINRAAQHDLVLYGDATAENQLVFGWRSARGPIGPQFANRELAIDWIAECLGDDDGSQTFHSA